MIKNIFEAKEERVRALKPLILSDGFKAVLNNILTKGKSSIAKRFLEWENDPEHLFDSTHIDRTDADDGVTFIQSARLQRLDDQGEKIDDIWKLRGRTGTSIGRLIRRLFGTRFDQQSIEKFVNKYKATIRGEKAFEKFELVEGDQIAHWYLRTRYEDNAGRRSVLNGSCMSGRECQNFFGIYTKNPNQVKLCILKNEKGDKIKGRAIIWQLAEPEGYTFMDRIYTHDDADVNVFVEYAKMNGWATKQRQTYRGDELLLPVGTKKNNVKLKVILEDVNFNRYPYMDTFRCFYHDQKILSNGSISGIGNEWTLNDTGGYYDEHGDYGDDYEPTYVTDWAGNEILEDDAIWCEYEEVYCTRADATYISKGENGRGKYFPPNTKLLVYSEYSDSKYHKDDSIYSEYMKDWVYKRYAVKVYFDQEKENWSWTHKLLIHDDMGKVGDDFFINSILYREQVKKKGKLVPGDYHFIDDNFNPIEDEEDEFFGDIPEGTKLDD